MPPPALAPPGDPIDALPLPKCGPNNAIVAVNATLGKILTPVSGLYFVLYASVDFTTWWQVRPTSPNTCTSTLKFTTSCSKPPLLGFQHLQPAFTVQCVSADGGEVPCTRTYTHTHT